MWFFKHLNCKKKLFNKKFQNIIKKIHSLLSIVWQMSEICGAAFVGLTISSSESSESELESSLCLPFRGLDVWFITITLLSPIWTFLELCMWIEVFFPRKPFSTLIDPSLFILASVPVQNHSHENLCNWFTEWEML